MNEYDVIVVGARCAGASLAIFLAQLGHRVCLLDRSTFPSDTLSTHVFGDWDLLRRLGVEDAILHAGAPRISRFRIDMDGCVLEGPVLMAPFVSGLRRVKFDQILLDQAQRFGQVDWRPGCTLVELVHEEDRVVGVRVREGAQESELRARAVVGADGRHSLVARLAGAKEYLEYPPIRCAFYGYFADVTPLSVPTFEFYRAGQDLFMVNPTDDGLHCLVVMPLQSEYADWQEEATNRLRDRLMQNPTLAPRLEHARMVGSIRGTGSLRSYLKGASGPGWALVGDAGAAVHPCIGAGMDQAAACSEMLAESLDGFLLGKQTWEEAMLSYQERRDARCRSTVESSAELASMPPLPADVLGGLRLATTLPGLAYQLVSQLPQMLQTILGESQARHLLTLASGGVTRD